MNESTAVIAAGIIGGYLAAGVLFALALVAFGLRRLDPATESAPVLFRALVLPGCALLWPIWLWRWVFSRPMPVESNAHRRRAARQ